ncbi:MAG TPA: hypothetical protein VFG00_10825 [Acidothermaceae bacterium]|nr:hypothetical protein [Acidothermaceae bacterium]
MRIVSRAQAAGILRPELEANDIPMVLWMTGAISDYTEPVSSDLWRRYLDFMLDGMLAESLPRRAISVPALDQAELETAMHNWHSHR